MALMLNEKESCLITFCQQVSKQVVPGSNFTLFLFNLWEGFAEVFHMVIEIHVLWPEGGTMKMTEY